MELPTDLLERCLFDKITVGGRPLITAVQLVGCIDSLDKSISYRNELIADFGKMSPIPPQVLLQKYLGVKTTDGITDEKFKGNLHAIADQTDDCIFFSRLLADDLLKHGRKLRRRHARSFRFGLPKLHTADWSEATASGLIPAQEG
jgi:hypothetical protein